MVNSLFVATSMESIPPISEEGNATPLTRNSARYQRGQLKLESQYLCGLSGFFVCYIII